MKLLHVLSIVSIVAVNRLGLFRQHHRRITQRNERFNRGTTVGETSVTALLTQFKLNQICTVKTCSKCDKLMAKSTSTYSAAKYCIIILNQSNCCDTKRFSYGAF